MPDTPLSSWWSHVQESLLDTAQQFKERKAKPGSRDPFHADSHPSFLLLPFPQTLPSAFIQTGIQIFAKHETNFKMSTNNFLKPNSSINSKKTFTFSKKNPTIGFLHFCNRSQSHSWSLVSSRGHFNEALLPWRKKVLHWSSDRMWSNLCTGLWNALHSLQLQLALYKCALIL